MLGFVEIEYFFPIQEAFCSYNKTQVSPYDPTKLAIHSILRPEDDLISNFCQKFKKTVCFDDIVHFIDEEDLVTYEDCGITFYPETPTKIRQINREQEYISRSCEKSQCIPSNDRHNCFIVEQYNCNIFLKPYNSWDMVTAALMSLNHTNDRYCMSNRYPQPTTNQPGRDSYPVFSSLRMMDSQRKGLRVSFAFFPRNYLPGGRVPETVAKVEELSDLWKPGTINGIPPFVMNCTCI